MQRIAKYAGIALVTGVQLFQSVQADTLRLIVKYKNKPASLMAIKENVETLVGMPLKKSTPMANGAYVMLFDSKEVSAMHLMKSTLLKLQNNPEILYAVEDKLGHFKPVERPQLSLNAKLLSHDTQWNEFSAPAGIRLESSPGKRDGAWSLTMGKGKKNVVIAILDTGIEHNESLDNSILKDNKGNFFGWNFSANNTDLSDDTHSYHGTHVAGTIASYGKVVNGVGEDLKILPIKVANASGLFYESSVINAIVWATGGKIPGIPENPYLAQVINASFSVDLSKGNEAEYCDQPLQEALDFARKQGAVITAAAGNENRWEHYKAPAVCNGVIRIAATGPEGLKAFYSNFGPAISFAAPGGDMHYGEAGGILSTVKPGKGYMGTDFDFFNGTSMAAPHVAGVAGLILAVSEKPLTPQQTEQILYTSTHEFGRSNNPEKSCIGRKPCGHGILDAESAVKTAKAGFDVLLTSPKPEVLGLSVCTPGVAKPGKAKIVAGNGIWEQVTSNCENNFVYEQGRLAMHEDGDIFAYYGSSVYKLDKSKFSRCEIIGYDGVGCWK